MKKKFRVSVPTKVWVNVEVEIDEEELKGMDEDERKEYIEDQAYEIHSFILTEYAGNGGHNKLVGVYGEGVSVEATDEADWDESEVNEID